MPRPSASCLEHLLGAIAGREDTAVAGAQVLLPDRHRVNAGDNVLHLSGLSWAGRYGLEVEDGPPRPAAVVSGAALLARRSAFEALGGYTDGFFMYYDDVDLAWRARLAGWEVLFCPEARVVHDYEFLKGNYKWRYLERNRWWCMLAYFELRTLVALVPLLLAVELAIWSRAISEGWAGAKLESYRALWADRRALYARRREMQRTRRIGDRAILERMSAGVDSPFLASQHEPPGRAPAPRLSPCAAPGDTVTASNSVAERDLANVPTTPAEAGTIPRAQRARPMGIDKSTLSFLAAARERGVSFTETVTIGRQALSFGPHDLARVLAAHGLLNGGFGAPRPPTNGWGSASGTRSLCFSELGATEVHSMDVSD